MAFVGINVIHGSILPVGKNTEIFGKATWSEELTAEGVTANAATGRELDDQGNAIAAFLVQPAVDGWVYIAADPNAAGTPRYRVYTDSERIIPAKRGDKLRWALA